jgi:hypothetical protein
MIGEITVQPVLSGRLYFDEAIGVNETHVEIKHTYTILIRKAKL